MGQIGKVAFIAGLVIAVAAGLGFNQPWIAWVLAILGVIVGFLNVGKGEAQAFLIAAIALIVAANGLAMVPYVGGYVTNIIANLVVFLAGAVVVVSLVSLFETARN